MEPPPPSSAPPSSAPPSSVFSRRPSFFKHLASRTAAPPSLDLAPPAPAPARNAAAPARDAAAPAPPATPRARRPASRHSISSSSLRSAASPLHHRRPSTATMHSLSLSPEKHVPAAAPLAASRPTVSMSTFARTKPKSSDNLKPDAPPQHDKPPLAALTPFMAVPLRHPPATKDPQLPQLLQRTPSTAGLAPAAPLNGPTGTNPHIIFQHIHELASKRISTLDYLRKAHEGRIYWFNTLLFNKADLTRLPSFTPRNQSRRATHYLLLGFSLPTILDLHATSPADYLRALNALLLEFEQYQSMHPTDGSAPSSLSRARIPHMFKRANLAAKSRRSSSATGDFPSLAPQTGGGSDTPNQFTSSFDPVPDDLLPNETYTHLQTPSLPFDPDFFSTFATLCDVLIDCYTRVLGMLSTPESVALAGQGAPSSVGDLFGKADARVRKILLAGVVREFEESCRAGVRGEVGGVGKVVLGGLM
ncbi:hypothetical protein EJ07DRAFT_179387 [Lizonia empirigonia]|nr:hypothetical protein EJ07DRAFT_179387 [Lizonia empirigonia]